MSTESAPMFVWVALTILCLVASGVFIVMAIALWKDSR